MEETTHSQPNVINHVLYIEDNPPNQRLMERFFDGIDGSEIHIADTAEKGWEMISQYVFDLILMDINLPGISGKELTQRIRNTPEFRHIPVVAVTAAAMDSDIDSAEGLFNDYLTKPLFFPVLTETLAKYLNIKF